MNNDSYHRLLQRQINKYLSEAHVQDATLKPLLDAIDASYKNHERDKELHDQSIALTDQEYTAINVKLKEELARKMQLEQLLVQSISKLQGDSFKQGADNKTVIELVTLLDVQIERTKAIETQLYQAKQAAEYANAAKSNFLSMMSHEIRTPLNAIIGLAHIMECEDSLESYRQNLGTLKISSNYLNSLINDVLDFAKIESGKLDLEKTPFPLKKMIEEICASMEIQAQEKGNHLHVVIDPKVPENVIGDPLRLGQILTNLVSNACKFTHHGHITVRCQFIENAENLTCIHFSVQDTGIGIDKDKQSIIFEEFTQADNSVTRRYGGSGLGLVITRKLLQLFGAEIYLESEPGKGSTFSFTLKLPRSELAQNASSLSSQYNAIRDLTGVRILLVEDHPVNIAVAKKILEMWGLEVDVAENGKIALDKYIPGRYALILMDIQMPIMDGYTATEKIRALDKTIPILALTASASLGNQDRAFVCGMNDYVTKPFNPRELHLKLCKNIPLI